MLRFIGLVVSLILGIICGNKIGAAVDSGLVGLVGGIICFVVFAIIAGSIISIIQGASKEISYRARRRQREGKIKYY